MINHTKSRKHRILITMLLRNNLKSITYQLDIFKSIENSQKIKFKYIFLENGSEDKTPEAIREFMNSRDGLIITIGNTEELDKSDRITRISHLRNQVKLQANNFDFEYMVILDSDIFFNPDVIRKLIERMDADNKIGVACAYGIAYLPIDNTIKTNNHYYDTSALIIEKNSASYYPRCIFKGCLECKSDKVDPAAAESIEVFSAFGGLALYREDVIKNKDISWTPAIMNNSPRSEHIGFFMKMHEKSDYKVTINTDCPVFWDISTLKL